MHDILTEIWATARRNKLRTTLTGFSVAWGIFMLIFLLGAGNGLINAQQRNSGNYLENSIMVGSGATTKAYDGLGSGRYVNLNQGDKDITERQFTQNVVDVGAEISRSGLVISHDGNTVSTSLSGVYPNEATINKRTVDYGRFINPIDIRQQRRVIVLSSEQAEELAPHCPDQLIGQGVKVGNFMFTVVGIYQKDESKSNNNAFTPFTTMRAIYGRGDRIDKIFFTFKGLHTERANKRFERSYRARLNLHHRAAPDDDGALWIVNRFTQALKMETGIELLHTALWVVGIFTLLSGVVGVGNIMLITVKERTREFGIRKAIGATPASILRLIIVESVVVTTLFGYVGMICGIVANLVMDATLGSEVIDTGLFKASVFVNPTVGFATCLETTLLMVVAGTVAGIVPARKAARIRPIEALRAE